MEFIKTSNLYSLNKFTYVNLRWIAYIGQISAILIVQFYLNYNFNYLICVSIVIFSILTNLFLQFRIKENQLSNFVSTLYLARFNATGFRIYGKIFNPSSISCQREQLGMNKPISWNKFSLPKQGRHN